MADTSMNSERIVRGQEQTLLRLLEKLRPYFSSDARLPERLLRALRERRFGSRDRRLYREMLYTFLRYLPWTERVYAADPRAAVRATAWLAPAGALPEPFRHQLLAEWPPQPGNLRERAALLQAFFPHSAFRTDELLPGWVPSECPELLAPEQQEKLLERAPLWIRLQGGEADRALDELTGRGISWQRSSVLPSAVQLPWETDLAALDAFREGRIEVQDLGSQMILALASPTGARWLDACAGAGGKTLQLAELLGPEGTVDAADPRREALAELERRAARGGFRTIRIIERPDPESYDGVLVDAPCSGSGTWRRSPHLKWQTTPATLRRAAQRQRLLLAANAAFVRAGGLLVYATCSIARTENQEVIRSFLGEHPDFIVEPRRGAGPLRSDPEGTTILPADFNSDGFFASVLRRT